MVISVGFLLIASLLASTLITGFSELLPKALTESTRLIQATEIITSFLLVSFFLSLIYRFLPSKKIGTMACFIGGFLAGTFFTLGKYALALYLGSSASLSIYGSAAALVIIILWTYYMAQIFFLSALLVKLYVLQPKGK